MKAWPVLGIAFMQVFLFLTHWFIYHTWAAFWWPMSASTALELRTTVFVLACSFMSAALLGFYHSNWLVRLFYRVAAVWLGLLNFFFWAACLCWLTSFAMKLAGMRANRPLVAEALFGLAVAVSLYGMVNARFIRIRRIPVQLPGLPESWRGRTALVVSDLHLGQINGPGFSRRIVALAAHLKPDVVFFPGDFFDGGKTDATPLAAPFRALAPPFGSYFSTGNHEGFGNARHYGEVLTSVGIRVLSNEKVTIDGLQILGVSNGDSDYPIRLRATLGSPDLVPGQASILLKHVPNRLPIVEQAGISLQISGHTHGGQLFPFTWLTRRAFGKFTYGLQQFGALQVYTSSGVGTWGPPMRVGTRSEIVLLTFV